LYRNRGQIGGARALAGTTNPLKSPR
jgi:hypothetical protein